MMRQLRYRLDRRRHPARDGLLDDILPVERLTRQQLGERQRRDFDAIVRFAAARTTFYARCFAPALQDTNGPIEASRLPLLLKQDVRDHLDDMLVRGTDPATVRVGHTGGSGGEPLAFYVDDAKHQLMLAGMLRGFMTSGWRPGQKVLYLWGASRDLAAGGVFAGPGRDLLRVERTIAAVEFSESRLAQWARLLRTWRPALLYGYASALAELARYVIDQDLQPPTGLLGAYATAEVLHDWQRELIERAFGCRVFNQYGCREVPNIAWERRHGRMHVFTDMVYLEALSVAGESRLLVKSLTNRLMPFIRYHLGDTGRLLEGECTCGLPFPMMQMDMCRDNDLIRTRAGKRLHPAYFNRLLYGLSTIRQYQWVQEGLDRMVLNLVAGQRLGADRLAEIVASLRRDVDPQITLEVRYLDAIPRTAAGKHRFVIGLPVVR